MIKLNLDYLYKLNQYNKLAIAMLHVFVVVNLTRILVSPEYGDKKITVPFELMFKFKQKFDELIEVDLHDTQINIYPYSLFFDNLSDFFRYYPEVWLDMFKIWERLEKKEDQRFDSAIDKVGYPDYYLQNFHHQTDGYLSDMSANLYDLQLDLFFLGTADAMRRRILAPLKQGLQAFSDVPLQQIRVLDVACGTGRTLRMIRGTLPKASLFGTDLSPAYLRKANQMLSEIPGELPQLVQANAEELPYIDNYFHVLTSVFLFHELPATARQNVIDEAFRVLQPGGVLVICDSMQANDSPEFEIIMKKFSAFFHEPYYSNYIQDNIHQRLEKGGFTNISIENHFISKYWIAYKTYKSN